MRFPGVIDLRTIEPHRLTRRCLGNRLCGRGGVTTQSVPFNPLFHGPESPHPCASACPWTFIRSGSTCRPPSPDPSGLRLPSGEGGPCRPRAEPDTPDRDSADRRRPRPEKERDATTAAWTKEPRTLAAVVAASTHKLDRVVVVLPITPFRGGVAQPGRRLACLDLEVCPLLTISIPALATTPAMHQPCTSVPA